MLKKAVVLACLFLQRVKRSKAQSYTEEKFEGNFSSEIKECYQ